MSRRLRIGTRGSALARVQAAAVAKRLAEAHPGLDVDIEIIRTTGDRLEKAALAQLAGETKGLFVKEIEEALLDGRVDLAVHSLKDLPSEMTPGLRLGAIPAREDPRDVLVSARKDQDTLDKLPDGAVVGTGSPRRRAQLLEARPDLEVVEIRGNVDTRLRRLAKGELDAVVLAAAGLVRLGRLAEISSYFEPEVMTPAVGQGALAVQLRDADDDTVALVEAIDDPVSRRCVDAERGFLARIGGGCLVPLGALARSTPEGDSFAAFWSGAPSGRTRASARGASGDLEALASEVFATLAGGGEAAGSS